MSKGQGTRPVNTSKPNENQRPGSLLSRDQCIDFALLAEFLTVTAWVLKPAMDAVHEAQGAGDGKHRLSAYSEERNVQPGDDRNDQRDNAPGRDNNKASHQ